MEYPSQIHAPPPVGYGVYWAIRQNWRGPLLLGFLFIALCFLTLVPWVNWEMNHQEKSYAAAIASIDSSRYRFSHNPRDSYLHSQDGLYRWTIVVWEKSAANTWQASSYACTVDRRRNYKVVSSRLEPYPSAIQNGERPPADDLTPADPASTP